MGRSKNHTTNTYRIQTAKVFYPEEKRLYRCHNCKIFFKNCRAFGGHKGKCKGNVRRSSATVVQIVDNFYDNTNYAQHFIENEEVIYEGKYSVSNYVIT